MNYSGILVGAAVFFCIGICHPAVIKMEYYLGKKNWWIWLAVVSREKLSLQANRRSRSERSEAPSGACRKGGAMRRPGGTRWSEA